MKSLADLCKPRQSVFDLQRRDVVLDITDLIDQRIEAKKFFEENFPTDGMKRLLREAFRRFAGKSDQGVFVLSQAMGGGKTHNMIALGLLAREQSLRKQVMGELYEAGEALGKVRVVGFTGRETDAPLGVWGSIAEQLGKKDQFKDYYSPLQPPGLTAWINLLKGEPLLVLLRRIASVFRSGSSENHRQLRSCASYAYCVVESACCSRQEGTRKCLHRHFRSACNLSRRQSTA